MHCSDPMPGVLEACTRTLARWDHTSHDSIGFPGLGQMHPMLGAWQCRAARFCTDLEYLWTLLSLAAWLGNISIINVLCFVSRLAPRAFLAWRLQWQLFFGRPHSWLDVLILTDRIDLFVAAGHWQRSQHIAVASYPRTPRT